MKTANITIKIVRCFSIGITIFAPSLNGVCIELNFACFSLLLWSKGGKLFAAENYWNKYN